MRIVPYVRERHRDGPWHVVRQVFDEYGFPFEENDYDADVLRPDLHYAGPGGWFAVAESDSGQVFGCVGLTDEGDGTWELHRLYVLATGRRSGAGSALVNRALDTARERGGRKVVLFSDIHFSDAHRLYLRHGFRCTRFRYAPDPWQSREWGFELDLA